MEQISNLFESVELSDEKQYLVRMAKEKASELYCIMEELSASREKALAITHLENSIMWFTKAVSRAP